MDSQAQLTNDAIIDLNRRFVNICLRASVDDLPELSVKMNCSMPVLRELRELNYDQLESVVSTPRCLLQPAISDASIRRAAAIKNSATRTLYVSTSLQVQNASSH